MPKSSTKIALKRVLILVASIAIGVAIVGYYVSNKQPPARVEAAERQTSVRVIKAAPIDLVVSATGFGTAIPQRTWSAISTVKGSVIFRHSDLESGAILTKGTLALEVDPAVYVLALAEANAEIAGIDAEIAQLGQEGENVAALLELERQRLDLAEQELERTTTLAASGAIPQSSLDAQLQATLQQRQALQALVNQQNIFPIQLNRLETQRTRARAKKAQVENDLNGTKFFAPFDMRISDINVELHQYINPGQILFSADGIAAAEVVLQVPMQNMRRLVAEIPDGGEVMDIGALSAYVQTVSEGQRWTAEVIRIANGIDPATRTVRVVLGIAQPETISDMFNHPPLPKGMYVEGVLQIPAALPQMVIPISALHGGWVYLVDSDNRLERRIVELSFQQGDLAIINAGLAAGEMVILDDVVPAVSGMLLTVFHDTDAEAALRVNAAGAVQ